MKKEASTPSNAFVIGAEDSDEEAKEDQIDLELQSQPSSHARSVKGMTDLTNTKQEILSTESSQGQEDSELGTLGKPAFPTMSAPNIIQVGHYMYLRCGHNGNFLNIERKVYERHLLAAGCLNPRHA